MNRAALFDLPFLVSHNCRHKKFISLNRAETFLGYNFYPRLNNIYTNLVQAMSHKDYRYLAANLDQSLASKLYKEMSAVDQGKFQLRLKMPKVKIVAPKPKRFDKFTRFRERVWNNGVTKIGLQCRVYFGQKFDREKPLSFERKDCFYQVGEFRHMRWDGDIGVLGNVKDWYKHQTFEFIVRYASKTHLKVLANGQVWKNEQGEDEQIVSELALQSGNDKFDWIVTDINGIASQ